MGKYKAGDAAPAFEATDIRDRGISLENYRGRKVMLSFYRYASCPLCNLRISELLEKQASWKADGLDLIAVFQSPKESIDHYAGKQGIPFPVIADPRRKLYDMYGVHADLLKFAASALHPEKLLQAAKKGFLPGKVENKVAMIPADFLIDESGKIFLAYYGKDASDHLDASVIESFIRR